MTLASLPLMKLFRHNRPAEITSAPLAQKLLICVDKVLGDWAQQTAHKVEDPSQEPEAGLVTLLAAMHGPQSGLFSVSTTPRLGSHLAVAATGDPGAASFGTEAMFEFFQLLRESILHEGLGLDGRDFLLHTPSVVHAAGLPEAPPSAALKVLVSGQPVELRLWMA